MFPCCILAVSPTAPVLSLFHLHKYIGRTLDYHGVYLPSLSFTTNVCVSSCSNCPSTSIPLPAVTSQPLILSTYSPILSSGNDAYVCLPSSRLPKVGLFCRPIFIISFKSSGPLKRSLLFWSKFNEMSKGRVVCYTMNF